MNRRAIFTFGLVVGLSPTACGTLTTSTTNDRLSGEWMWVESVGGIAGMTLTPESTGETMTLRFRHGDSIDLVRDGSLQRSVGYETTRDDSDGEFLLTTDPPLFSFESQTAAVRVDTLILVDPCCDGFIYRFVR